MTTTPESVRPMPRAARQSTRREHLPKHAPRIPFAMLVVGLIVGGLCALLALNTASAANELARHDVAGKDSDVADQLEQVRNEVAASAAPGSLGSAAAALGMVPAGAPAFLRIDATGKVTLLGRPARATSVPQFAPALPKATPAKASTAPAKPVVVSPKATTKHVGATSAPTPKSHPRPSTPRAADPAASITLPGGPR